MSPLEAIVGWLEKQDSEIQSEVAGCAAYLLFETDGVLALGGPEQLQAVKQWLSEPHLPSYRAVGRAVRFRACFEYFAEGRFTDSGWKLSEELFRETIAEATRDPNSEAARFALNAQRMLNNLPARKEKWRQVGHSWRELVEAHLTNEALSDWNAAETAKRVPGS
ncbi:hypothetical protein OZ411_28665 [Bradyrhizobium sp. Arg237L]|uniref:hypothetical protein n=1 Tax=Bradyrhizobium sp. Arg237L TaxID=3003352 RepID=UPI00249E683D|nr:hypothetical protein [Bradyrhizobium sp. Arg237L]MDI4236790.1 hypothetical protein [Bradyrhizobium sp. Arg237L]